MRVAVTGEKWEMAKKIYSDRGKETFFFSELGFDLTKQGYLRAMIDNKMVIRIKRKTSTTPTMYRLSDELIQKLQRFPE